MPRSSNPNRHHMNFPVDRRPFARNRRGVILLVVLSLLVLFTLIAITFVILATQHKKIARADARAQFYDDGRDESLRQAAMQVIRGSNNPRSVVGFHSVMEDMYGNDGVVGRIPAASLGYAQDGINPAQGAGMDGRFLTLIEVPIVGMAGDPPYPQRSEHYQGRPLTFLDGAAAGHSSRVRAYGVNFGSFWYRDARATGPDQWATIQTDPHEGMRLLTTPSLAWTPDAFPVPGDRFVINGRPYNGGGAGWFDGEPWTDDGDGVPEAGEWTDLINPGSFDEPGLTPARDALGREFALLPFPPHPWEATYSNYQAHLVGRDGGWGIAGRDDDGNGIVDDAGEAGWPGGDDLVQYDEDYDVPDFQNMLLAARVWNTAKQRWDVALPSLTRPDLLHYWLHRYAADLADTGNASFDLTNPAVTRELLRRVYPRPIEVATGRADFTGNSTFALGSANVLQDDGNSNDIPDALEALCQDLDGDGFPDVQYDVDNDGDGLADSVWVDIGLPVRTAPNGRRYKPLAAILVLDQDGRANINVHGTVHHYRAVQTDPPPSVGDATEEYVLGPVARRERYGDVPNAISGPFAGGNPAVPLPQGSGYSVGEVNLGAVLPAPYDAGGTLAGTTINEYRRMLQGEPPSVEPDAPEGRYGERHVYSDGRVPMPGLTSSLTASTAGLDGVAGTADDTWDGDDNQMVAAMAALAGAPSHLRKYSGNQYADGFLPGMGLGNYSTPGDADGNGALALDVRGQPCFIGMGTYHGAMAPYASANGLPEAVDEPTEMALDHGALHSAKRSMRALGGGQSTTIDNPFTAADHERLWRPFDGDVGALSDRLERLAPRTAADHYRRGLLTPESWDLPNAGIAPPREVRRLMAALRDWSAANSTDVPAWYANGFLGAGNATLLDMIIARLIRGGVVTLPLNPDKIGRLNNEARVLLAEIDGACTPCNGAGGIFLNHDLVRDLRLDINRPLGNARDDDANGAVDDLMEVYANPTGEWSQYLWRDLTSNHEGIPVTADGLGGHKAGHLMMSRQRLARQLYILAMLFADTGAGWSSLEPDVTDAEERDLMARRIAQWAVNVVDFRDADSIMTMFEYDANPWNGWQVDGYLGMAPYGADSSPGPDGIARHYNRPGGEWGNEFVDDDGNGRVDDYGDAGRALTNDTPSVDDSDPVNYPDRRLVWGCEYPDLLLTEAVAFHDRRVRDLAEDNGDAERRDDNDDGLPDDDDLDQYRVPEGSAFFELYCTGNPNNPNPPRELYMADGRLDLTRMTPASAGPQYPVWRLVILASDRGPNVGTTLPRNDVRERIRQRPDTISLFDQHYPSLLQHRYYDGPGSAHPTSEMPHMQIERIVWLGNVPPDDNTDRQKRAYWNRSSTPVGLMPGHYAVVGPRVRTRIGWTDANEVGGTQDPPQEITLDTVGVTTNNPTVSYDYPTVGTEIQPPVGIVAAATDVNGNEIGISVSEPLYDTATRTGYYPLEPTVTLYQVPGAPRADCYADPTNLSASPARDEPLDSLPGAPLADDDVQETGTYLNYKTVLLQRLADPTQPWNPQIGTHYGAGGQPFWQRYPRNPYVTVDWLPIDLTVFNGEDRKPATSMITPFDPVDPSQDEPDRETREIRFATRQRGTVRFPSAGTGTYNLWDNGVFDPSNDPPRPTLANCEFANPTQPVDTYNFGHNLDHTLGYLNRSFHELDPGIDGALFTDDDPPHWITQANLPAGYATGDIGAPLKPFPWLTWNNRPYHSALEVLQVPACDNGRLLLEFDVRRPGFGDHYRDHVPSAPSTTAKPASGPPFGHLLNFFRSAPADPAYEPTTPHEPTGPTAASGQSNLYRMLEFINVPSRFGGGESHQVPGFGGYYNVPFQVDSNYREPGRININTMFDAGDVWRAAIGCQVPPGESDAWWQRLVHSRRGYPAAGPANSIAALMPPDPATGRVNSPTMFANPVRSYSNEFLNVPLDSLRFRNCDPSGVRHDLVDATLLRRDPLDPDRPLLSVPDSAFSEHYRDQHRNPAFRYQALQKAGNVFTTRSHVFAIWVTVGNFEVEPVIPDVDHPDGYALVHELGSETGEIERHRAFFVFDRSRPVGFLRGQDLNVEKALLIRRFIE
jgi:hypothetical protein